MLLWLWLHQNQPPAPIAFIQKDKLRASQLGSLPKHTVVGLKCKEEALSHQVLCHSTAFSALLAAGGTNQLIGKSLGTHVTQA